MTVTVPMLAVALGGGNNLAAESVSVPFLATTVSLGTRACPSAASIFTCNRLPQVPGVFARKDSTGALVAFVSWSVAPTAELGSYTRPAYTVRAPLLNTNWSARTKERLSVLFGSQSPGSPNFARPSSYPERI